MGLLSLKRELTPTRQRQEKSDSDPKLKHHHQSCVDYALLGTRGPNTRCPAYFLRRTHLASPVPKVILAADLGEDSRE
jgi:hypothetical protein